MERYSELKHVPLKIVDWIRFSIGSHKSHDDKQCFQPDQRRALCEWMGARKSLIRVAALDRPQMHHSL